MAHGILRDREVRQRDRDKHRRKEELLPHTGHGAREEAGALRDLLKVPLFSSARPNLSGADSQQGMQIPKFRGILIPALFSPEFMNILLPYHFELSMMSDEFRFPVPQINSTQYI